MTGGGKERATRRREQALAFLVRRHSGECGPEEGRVLETWLAEDPANAAELERVERLWIRLGMLPALGSRAGPRRTPRAAYACAAAGALAAAAAVAWSGSGELVLRAGRDRLSQRLADGSLVELDARSTAEVRLTPWGRSIELRAGRLHVQVAHGLRPFRVRAEDVAVEDLGTGFSVERAGSAVAVVVTEGRVRVRRGGRTVELSAGDRAQAGPTGIEEARRVDLTQALPWREGLVIFDRTPLREALEAMARYHEVESVQLDRASSGLRLSGRFRTADLDGFISAVEAVHPVSMVRAGGTLRASARR